MCLKSTTWWVGNLLGFIKIESCVTLVEPLQHNLWNLNYFTHSLPWNNFPRTSLTTIPTVTIIVSYSARSLLVGTSLLSTCWTCSHVRRLSPWRCHVTWCPVLVSWPTTSTTERSCQTVSTSSSMARVRMRYSSLCVRRQIMKSELWFC